MNFYFWGPLILTFSLALFSSSEHRQLIYEDSLHSKVGKGDLLGPIAKSNIFKKAFFKTYFSSNHYESSIEYQYFQLDLLWERKRSILFLNNIIKSFTLGNRAKLKNQANELLQKLESDTTFSCGDRITMNFTGKIHSPGLIDLISLSEVELWNYFILFIGLDEKYFVKDPKQRIQVFQKIRDDLSVRPLLKIKKVFEDSKSIEDLKNVEEELKFHGIADSEKVSSAGRLKVFRPIFLLPQLMIPIKENMNKSKDEATKHKILLTGLKDLFKRFNLAPDLFDFFSYIISARHSKVDNHFEIISQKCNITTSPMK